MRRHDRAANAELGPCDPRQIRGSRGSVQTIAAVRASIVATPQCGDGTTRTLLSSEMVDFSCYTAASKKTPFRGHHVRSSTPNQPTRGHTQCDLGGREAAVLGSVYD